MKAGDLIISLLILIFFVGFISSIFSGISIYRPDVSNVSFTSHSENFVKTTDEIQTTVYAFANTTYGEQDLFTQLQIAWGLGTYIIFGMLKALFFGIIQTPIILISLITETVFKTENPFLLTIFSIILPLITVIISVYIVMLIIKIFTQRGDV